jgi:hypothetical protein
VAAAAHWARSAKQPQRNPEADNAERQSWNTDKAAWDAASAWADEDEGTAAGDEPEEGSFVVWPENWETIRLFWSVRRCWLFSTSAKLVGMSVIPIERVTGLNWPAVESKMRLRGLGRRRMLRESARLELMEEEALKEFARG